MPWSADADWVKQHPDQRLVIGVAVDGSALGDKALAAAAALHRERRGDRVRALAAGAGGRGGALRCIQGCGLLWGPGSSGAAAQTCRPPQTPRALSPPPPRARTLPRNRRQTAHRRASWCCCM
jgi:hypothetical protein